ncbi:MAG: hypothetical protein ACFFCW_49825, partial [Candidatus Hodarchaeota archaeon]
ITATTFSLFSLYQELVIVVSGLFASSLIGVIYIAPLALIIHFFKKVKVHPRTRAKRNIILINTRHKPNNKIQFVFNSPVHPLFNILYIFFINAHV